MVNSAWPHSTNTLLKRPSHSTLWQRCRCLCQPLNQCPDPGNPTRDVEMGKDLTAYERPRCAASKGDFRLTVPTAAQPTSIWVV